MKNIFIVTFFAMTSVGCSISCDIQTHQKSDAGAAAPSDETSLINKKPALENAMTASEIIIYANE